MNNYKKKNVKKSKGEDGEEVAVEEQVVGWEEKGEWEAESREPGP